MKAVNPLNVLIIPVLCLCSCLAKNPAIESGKRLTPYGLATEPAIPLGVPSDETTAEQLLLAKELGQREQESVNFLLSHAPGAEMMAGEFYLACILEDPKGYYKKENTTMQWHEGSGGFFLSLAVRDAFDGRTVPGLTIAATISESSGKVLWSGPLPFAWHPLLHRYGENIPLPESGNYTFSFRIEPAPFRRHDPINGDRYRDTVEAEFRELFVNMEKLADPATIDNLKEWLPYAQAQGIALRRAIDEMIAATAIDGSMTRHKNYLLVYAVEYAEGYYVYHGDHLRYDISIEASAEKNAHIEVAALDGLTGRFIPGIEVTATFYKKGKKVGSYRPVFMWHPWLYHYGENIRAPSSGKYELEISAVSPSFRFYGEGMGSLYGENISFRFTDVDIKTGEK